MTNFDFYFDYLYLSIIDDVQGFMHWWMILIFPAVLYTIFLLIKYWVLTMPMWLPVIMIVKVINFNSIAKHEAKIEILMKLYTNLQDEHKRSGRDNTDTSK